MRRPLRVFLIVAAVVILALGALYLTQRSNIDAAVVALTSSEEEIQQRRVEAKQTLKEELEQATGLDLEAIETEALAETEPEPENQDLPSPAGSAATPSAPQAQDSPARSTDVAPLKEAARSLPGRKGSAEVQSILTRFYQLQASYTGQLESIRSGAIASYSALPPEEHTTSAKISAARSAVSAATSLEHQCDGEVSALVGQLRKALENCGLDPDLADNVWWYYLDEKGMRKAAYMSEYKKYLS